MTAEPNRQPGGIPVGGQFAAKIKSDDVVTLAVAPEPSQNLGKVLSDRYFAAKAQMDAHDQNEWVRDVHEDFTEAAYAKVNIETDAGGRYTAGVDLYTANGAPIELDSSDTAILEDDFDTDWDMFRHRNVDAEKLFGFQSGVFSLRSIQDSWAAIESSTEAPSDPFAHLTGMDKAKAQGAYARELSSEAAAAYVDDISTKLMAANPASARLYFTRRVDVESGLTFDMDRVEDVHRNAVDADLSAIEDTTFQDGFLDGHLDHDVANDELYLNLDRGE